MMRFIERISNLLFRDLKGGLIVIPEVFNRATGGTDFENH